MKNRRKFFLIYFISFIVLVTAQKTNFAPSVVATDNYFGFEVKDEYRNLENIKDSSTLRWMKDQTKHSLSLLQAIPNRQYYIDKRIEYDRKQAASISHLNITDDQLYFYLKRSPEEKTSKLFYKKKLSGQEIEIFDPANYRLGKNISYQINYIKPNHDGSKVAIALTESGKEISEMVIYDLSLNKLLPITITNCWPSDSGGISWLPDNKSFIYLYYPVTDPNSKLFLKDMEAVIYKLGDDPEKRSIILSKKNNPDLKINSEDFPRASLPTKTSKYFIGQISGAATFKDTYFSPVNDFKKEIKWQFLFSKEDKISDFIIQGDYIIYISEKNNSNAICKTSLENPDFKHPELLVPQITTETISGVYGLKNGFIFNTSKNGVEAKLYQYHDYKIETLILPIPTGDISITTQNDFSNDFWITCSGWKNDNERFKYNASKKEFTPENIAPISKYPEFDNVVVEEITVKSHDGLDVPISLMYQKGIKKNSDNPLLIYAYGAYGVNASPVLSKTYMLWVLKGGIVAVAHVRGGGEKGELWHEGGFKKTKPNSWKDLIACADYMTKQGYTSQSKIAIWGGSAGGITIGRAITVRPDLFKVAIIEAGIVNATRMEFTPNGLNSAKEFGSLSNESEFRSLLEMDAFQHIKKDEKYPATLITSGINDPRVSVWMPTKFAAKLIANNNSKNPILLKIDYNGGHGSDIPVAQKYANTADVFAFALWKLGHPDYQPKTK